MPWISVGKVDDSLLIVCGGCAMTMERYVVSRGYGDIVVVAERCVQCRIQFNLKPKPDEAKFGSVPPTGDIIWEQKHEENKSETGNNHRFKKSRFLGISRDSPGRGRRSPAHSHRRDHREKS